MGKYEFFLIVLALTTVYGQGVNVCEACKYDKACCEGACLPWCEAEQHCCGPCSGELTPLSSSCELAGQIVIIAVAVVAVVMIICCIAFCVIMCRNKEPKNEEKTRILETEMIGINQ